MGRIRNTYILPPPRKPEGKRPLWSSDADVRTILQWSLKKHDVFKWLRIENNCGFL
jgi:hypothetical protein